MDNSYYYKGDLIRVRLPMDAMGQCETAYLKLRHGCVRFDMIDNKYVALGIARRPWYNTLKALVKWPNGRK